MEGVIIKISVNVNLMNVFIDLNFVKIVLEDL